MILEKEVVLVCRGFSKKLEDMRGFLSSSFGVKFFFFVVVCVCVCVYGMSALEILASSVIHHSTKKYINSRQNTFCSALPTICLLKVVRP
jgi:hypothetical protein